MTQPVLRRKVREVLATVPDRRFTEEMMLDGVNDLVPLPADVSGLRKAIEWNQQKGLIDYVHNAEMERDEWFLTDRGKQEEGVK